MKQFTIGSATVAICLAAGVAQASVASDKAAIRSSYKKMEAHLQRGDVAKAGTYMTSDYKQKLIGGQVMNKQQSLGILSSTMKATQMKMQPIKIHSMQIKGNRATVVAFGAVTMRVRNPQGQTDTIYSGGKTRDHWVKLGGGWKERYVEQLSEEVRINGRVVSKR